MLTPVATGSQFANRAALVEKPVCLELTQIDPTDVCSSRSESFQLLKLDNFNPYIVNMSNLQHLNILHDTGGYPSVEFPG